MVPHRKSESEAERPARRSEGAVKGSERPIGGSRGQLEGLGGQIDRQEGSKMVSEADWKVKRPAGGSERLNEDLGASHSIWGASRVVWRLKLGATEKRRQKSSLCGTIGH